MPIYGPVTPTGATPNPGGVPPFPDPQANANPDGSVDGTALPVNLEELFPNFKPVKFNTIQFPTINPANYNFVDPTQFAKAFSDFNKIQIGQNFGQAKGLALDALRTELQGLKAFAPAAAALKREQISVDNLFNQQQRLQQIGQVLPEAQGDLAAQRKRALAYAGGRLPDEVQDRALDIQVGGRAADRSAFTGVGATSQQSRNLSDLMSAEERFQIAQYGEGLFGQNLSTKANLLLSPTEYSQAGNEIRATPEVGAGRLTYQGLGAINEATLLPPSAALATQVQQEQFRTNLDQRVNEFNANGTFDARKYNSQGQFQAGMFNSTGMFTAGLGLFNYQVDFAAQQQAANQHILDQVLGAQIQGINAGGFDAGVANGQNAQTIKDTAASLNIVPSAIQSIGNALNSGGATTGTATLTGGPLAVGGTGPVAAPSTSTSPSLAKTSLDVAAANYSPSLSTPASLKVPMGAPAPSGYTPISNNNDGTYAAANISDYKSDLDRFAKTANVQPGSIKIENAALADKNLSEATGLSYLPVPGFPQIAMTSSGRNIYSTPMAAKNGDFLLGKDTVNSLGISLVSSGVTDPATLNEIGRLSNVVSDPAFLTSLDRLSREKGEDAVTQGIINKVLGKTPNADTPEGQQIISGASRIGQIWGNLSPSQKSLALSSLAGPTLKAVTGKDIGTANVPGTERSPVGPLKVGVVASLNAQGKNGYSVARNWNQLSAISDMAGAIKDPNSIASVSNNIGLLGFGPQGASVPMQVDYLKKVNSTPAPEFGVGATIFRNQKDVPPTYKAVSKTPRGGIIAMPANLVHTSSLRGPATQALSFKKGQEISSKLHPAQKLWGSPPTRGLIRGSVGGSALVSGLGIMTKANPALFSSIASHSLFNETLGNG